MKIETKFLKPKLGTFIKYLVLALIPFWSLGTLIYMYTAPNPFDTKIYDWWINLILIPIGSAVGYSLGTRRFHLIISETTDLEKTKSWALDFLLRNGLKIKSTNDIETIIQSKKGHNQIFGNWFGTELTSIKKIENRIEIDGPFRHIDIIETKLKLKEVPHD